MSRLVAATATRRTDDGRERIALNTAYVRALSRAGLVPVIVAPTLDPACAVQILPTVSGLVLTGGEDVDPARYRALPHPRLGEIDPQRDAVELALIGAAQQRELPILAICRGIQVLNVALGGTLYQDLPSERPGRVDHAGARSRHGLAVQPGSLLERILGSGARAASVNSRHHQAIRELAPGLRATAWADDGLIEGVEHTNRARWILGVQWHPEDDVEDVLFSGFAQALA